MYPFKNLYLPALIRGLGGSYYEIGISINISMNIIARKLPLLTEGNKKLE